MRLWVTEAIVVAEKAPKASATKAERKDHPAVQFRIDVIDGTGNKSKVILDAGGKVVQIEKKDEDKDEKDKKKEKKEAN